MSGGSVGEGDPGQTTSGTAPADSSAGGEWKNCRRPGCRFLAQSPGPYHSSFCCGVCEALHGDPDVLEDEVVHGADCAQRVRMDSDMGAGAPAAVAAPTAGGDEPPPSGLHPLQPRTSGGAAPSVGGAQSHSHPIAVSEVTYKHALDRLAMASRSVELPGLPPTMDPPSAYFG